MRAPTLSVQPVANSPVGDGVVGSNVVYVAVGCVLPGLEGRILRGQLEAASQHVDLRQLDRGELGLKLELG